MREIKFRGRRKNSDEWVYGAFLAIPRLCSYIYDVQPDGQATRYLVDEDTVGQFTGLKDCKGQEIFEGDIVRTDDWSTPSYIRWDVATASFVVDRWSVNLAHVDEIKVIGNVYDNSELLS